MNEKQVDRMVGIFLKAVLWACLVGVALIAVSCAPYPDVGYYEMDAAIKAAQTKEEADYYRDKLEQFESRIIDSNEWIATREFCDISSECTMLCKWRGSFSVDTEKSKFKDLVDQVKWWRTIRGSCHFYEEIRY